MSTEQSRLDGEAYTAWLRWGPYLAERAWGTVREDYSANGDVWEFFPHDHARSRTYRWNEDGLAGISDDEGRMCFALALWNGQDPYLKERLFGLSNPEGNHGEDVKEIYFYLDSTPTHSFMRMLYRYPQQRFPYDRLVEENGRRGKEEPEFELQDTGIFDENRYFDVVISYAKAAPYDILIRISATNRAAEAAPLTLLPTLWYRNVWSWSEGAPRPILHRVAAPVDGVALIEAHHWIPRSGVWVLGSYAFYCERPDDLLFTENDTNQERLWGVPNPQPYVKDAFHRYVVDGEERSVNSEQSGTKASALYHRIIPPGGTETIRLRLTAIEEPGREPPGVRKPHATPLPAYNAGARTPREPHPLALSPFTDFDLLFQAREREADEYYATRPEWRKGLTTGAPSELFDIYRQALGGMLWSKQFYHYVVERWLKGDPAQPAPPSSRSQGRNSDWTHFYAERVFTMPDTWEYPWFATWDLAFHCVTLTLVDPQFAKTQLDHLLREWSQHPNGQVPAYEWDFGDVNPPVEAWAAWQVYRLEQRCHGRSDLPFLERLFHKLLLSFTWWVNRKDTDGNDIFHGDFLGLDNIGVFDRSKPLPTGGDIEQSDGTAWMGFFSLSMLTIAVELAHSNPVYESIATKFFEHFLDIASAMTNMGERDLALWDEEDAFFYDVVHLPESGYRPLKVRSMVGLIPLFAVSVISQRTLEALPGFRERLEWYLEYRPGLNRLVGSIESPGYEGCRLLSLVNGDRLRSLLRRAFDRAEFLSPFGIRSLSKFHEEHPFIMRMGGVEQVVRYEPGVSRSGLFGGNSNWRGPVWFPLNYLLILALRAYHEYYGDDFLIEFPTGSGKISPLDRVADMLSWRLLGLFLPDEEGERPFARGWWSEGSRGGAWRDPLLFHEFFHAESGAGLGASHQTGWTGLVANLIQEQAARGFPLRHPGDNP